jgi:hypothetical protein
MKGRSRGARRLSSASRRPKIRANRGLGAPRSHLASLDLPICGFADIFPQGEKGAAAEGEL